MAVCVQVGIDCADPARLAGFWAPLLGYKGQDPPPGFDSWQAFLAPQGVPESEWEPASALVDPPGPAGARRLAIGAAVAPAPTPLSMLTTTRPGAQVWSMDSRAATPPPPRP